MQELIPCPFCGSQFINEAEGEDHSRMPYRQCLCNTCGAEGQKFMYGCFPYAKKSRDEAAEEARFAWNCRSAPKREVEQPDDKSLEEIARRCAQQANQHNDSPWFDQAEEIAFNAAYTALSELAPKREAINPDLEERIAIRERAIEEVAKHYHGAMADFYKEQGDEEPLPGIAEDWHKKAKTHRTYAREIREQVWLKDDFNQIEAAPQRESGGWNVAKHNVGTENEWRDGFNGEHYTYDTGKQTLFVFNLEPAEAEAIKNLLTEGNNIPAVATNQIEDEASRG